MASWISLEGSVLFPPLTLGFLWAEGCPQWPPLAGMGAIPSPILQTLGLVFLALVQAQEVPLVSWWGQGSVDFPPLPLQGEAPP